ncbi:hypothetical protein [Burkholderia sp. Ac-20345]|uniref:hypothetical protein n=1 Tax=Burkholderia sp. Ac-20345 TaxID=2703891 RepID=UPI00197B5E12|nr:hypothetical protein [Burkholderia sp. Ac-20345]
MATSKSRPARPYGRNGFKYQSKYGVIVLCADEADRQRVYRDLTRQGYKLKVVCV